MATKLDVLALEEAPARPTSWTEALIAWRAAERELASIPASSPEGNALRAEIEALRLLYKELSGQFAAQATPVPRATPIAQPKMVGPGTPVGPGKPVGPGTAIGPGTPVDRQTPAARPKAAARTKPPARAKLNPESARAG